MGHVPVAARGSLPFALLHGEPLVVVASLALVAADVEVLDFNVTWTDLQRLGRPVVLHDPLCPLTPVPFLRSAVQSAAATGCVVVGVRPVTDTIKTATAGVVGETVDRESLWTVTSPVVLPTSVVAALRDWPDLDDVAALVSTLRERFPMSFLEAPPLGRRIEDESSLVLLEAIEEEQRGGHDPA